MQSKLATSPRRRQTFTGSDLQNMQPQCPVGPGCRPRNQSFWGLRLYSRVVVCVIKKIEVYYIDFSRPSPESKTGREIHQNNRFGSGSDAPQPESPTRISRAKAALNSPVTDRRASFTRRFRAVLVRYASIRPNLSPPRGVGPK